MYSNRLELASFLCGLYSRLGPAFSMLSLREPDLALDDAKLDSRVAEPESEFFWWSRSQISNNTGSRSRIFCPIPTPDVQLDRFLHHTLKLGITVKMVEFLFKRLLKQRFLALHHDFH